MSAHEYAVSPADGPIAVTGASGYIGSWIVQDCMEQGYEVRACVRDATNPAKTEHLLDLNTQGMRGQLSLFAQQGIGQRRFTGTGRAKHHHGMRLPTPR